MGITVGAEQIDEGEARHTGAVDGQQISKTAWRMFKADARNTGYHPTASGPTDEPTQRWCFETDAVSVSSPAVVNDTAYVGTDEGAVYALDVASGATRDGWPFTTDGSVRSIPTVVDGTVYVGSGETIYALTADAGEERWCFETDGQGGSITGSPTVVDGTVYVGSTGGNIYALDAASGALQDGWPHSGGNPKSSTPAVADGMVYVTLDTPDGPELRALNTDGTVEWVFPFPVRDTETTGITVLEPTSPAVADGSVYFGSKNKSLYAVDAATGERQWEFRRRKPIQSSPAVADGTVYAGFDNWFLYAVDAGSGEEVWRHELDDAPVRTAPAVVDGTLYVSTVDRTVYAFDPEPPEERWRVELDIPDAGVRSPTVVDGTVYVGTNDGMMCALDGEGGRSTGNELPEAVIDLEPDEPAVGRTATFDASESTAPGGSITSYEWDLDGDGEFEAVGERVTTTFDDVGDYEVRLRVTDDEGRTATTTITVSVSEAEPLPLRIPYVHLVQTVGQTSVTDTDQELTHPKMVAERPTSLIFGLDADPEWLADLPADWRGSVTVHLTRSDAGDEEYPIPSETFELGPDIVEELVAHDEADGPDPWLVFQEASPAQTPPVFTLPADLEAYHVRIEDDDNTDGLIGDVTQEPGEDFRLAEMGTLKVALVEVRAPESDTGMYGTAAGRISREYDDPETGSRVTAETVRDKLEVLADEIETYLRRTYPVADVIVVVADTVTGTAERGDHPWDLAMADTLRSVFDDLDATLAIVPEGYTSHHTGRAAGGFELINAETWEKTPNGTVVKNESQPPTAAVVEDYDRDLKRLAVTAAQEFGHHFTSVDFYPDGWAQRRSSDKWDDLVLDNAHARTEEGGWWDTNVNAPYDVRALRSRAYDFWDGTYTVLREGGTEGYWGRGRDSPDSGQDGADRLGSFMSYGRDDLWADAFFYDKMIESELQPTPPVEEWDGSDGDAGSIRLVGSAVQTQDGIEVIETRTSKGLSMVSTESGATFRAVDTSGQELTAVTIPPKTFSSHAGGESQSEETFVFGIPYPQRTATVEIDHDGERTELVPHSRTLADEIDRVPDRGYVEDPTDTRQSLHETVDTLETDLTDEAYDAAATTLDELQTAVERGIKPNYDAAANQPTRSDLVSLIEDVRARISHLAVDASGRFGVPDWVPVAGGAGLLGIGAGAYKYLSGTATQEADDET